MIDTVDSPADPVDDARQLQADEHEEHGVEDEDEDLPTPRRPGSGWPA
jgi:hypothetical protein